MSVDSAPTLCLYTTLFTLKDKKPEENHYIQLFLLWLSHLLHKEIFTEHDALHIYIDEVSFAYLKTSISFESLCLEFPFKLNFKVAKQPVTLYDGCCWRYFIDLESYTQDILLYCDIDIYINSSLKNFCKMMDSNKLYAHPEGDINNPDYGGRFSQQELAVISNAYGFSAGKFAIRGKELAELFFSSMKECIANHTSVTPYYTLDQPLFNYVLYTQLKPRNIDVELFYSVISTNLQEYTPDTLFLDCMGEPGNGALHLEKFIHIMCLFHAGIL